MAKEYLYTFTVESISGFPFPLDMLRRDGCYPKTEEDAATIASSFSPGLNSASKVKVTVCSTRHGWSKWMPTTERWKSFGWRVMIESIRIVTL